MDFWQPAAYKEGKKITKKKLLAKLLAAAVIVTSIAGTVVPAETAQAAEPTETVIEKIYLKKLKFFFSFCKYFFKVVNKSTGKIKGLWIKLRKLKWLNLTFGRSIWSKANNNYIDDAGTIVYEQDKWQLVTLAVQGDRAKLYVNGDLKGNGSIASNVMGQENAAIYFGVNAWDACFKGSLDEVKIYNNALGEQEIMALAASLVEKPEELPQPDPNAPGSSGIFSDGDITTPGGDNQKPGGDNQQPGGDNQKPQVKIKKVTVKAANQKPGANTVYLKKGGKAALVAIVTRSGNFSKAVEWKSSKTSVATVKNGVVKAKKAGVAKITVLSKSDKTKKASITIKVSEKEIKNNKLKLKAAKKTLNRGKTYTVAIKSITNKTTDAVTYKSSKKGRASIDKFGVVTAKKKGKAVITVKCGKKSAKLTIIVK